jgi:hypothetical protein
VSVCGPFSVVTFRVLLTSLFETSCDCPAFADSPHLHVVFPREMKHSPQYSNGEVKDERGYAYPCPCTLSRRVA